MTSWFASSTWKWTTWGENPQPMDENFSLSNSTMVWPEVWFTSTIFLSSLEIIAWATELVPWTKLLVESLLVCWNRPSTYGETWNEVNPLAFNHQLIQHNLRCRDSQKTGSTWRLEYMAFNRAWLLCPMVSSSIKTPGLQQFQLLHTGLQALNFKHCTLHVAKWETYEKNLHNYSTPRCMWHWGVCDPQYLRIQNTPLKCHYIVWRNLCLVSSQQIGCKTNPH